jgi:hypothetical protein
MKTFILILLCQSTQLFAWGSIGHQVVGEIAQNFLQKSTKRKVKKILGGQNLADVSIWADEIRSRPEQSKIVAQFFKETLKSSTADLVRLPTYWHYATLPDGKNYFSLDPVANGDVIWAVKTMISTLQKSKDSFKRKLALRLLTHYIGDLHQPLHVGNGKDKGANYCWVSWFKSRYHKNIDPTPKEPTEYVNLHALWDSKIIDHMKLSYTEYAQKILRLPSYIFATERNQHIQKDQLNLKKYQTEFKSLKSKWEKDTLMTWIYESRDLRNIAYLGKYKTNQLAEFCFENFKQNVDAQIIPNVSYDEIEKIYPVIEKRLLQAGIRLAAVLNKVL